MFRYIPFLKQRLNTYCRYKHTLDFSKVPKLIELDLEEQFVRGSGPGGQSVNKTANCVVLIHKPTGIVVKCHETRSLDQNRKKARALLVTRLDNLINQDDSIEAQQKRNDEKKRSEYEKKQQKLRDLKKEWKIRNNIK